MDEVREGYKMTEFGEIPSEWHILRLDELSIKITDGSHSSPIEIEESNFKICSVKHMKKGRFDYDNALPISEKDYLKLKNNGCNPIAGDVLLSKDGTIGKTFVFNQPNLNIVLLSSIAIIRCDEDKIIPNFLKYFLENPNTILKLIGMKSGSAIKRIVLRDISNLLVILPDIKEQQKIASILSTVDEQIDETEQLIVKTKELKKGLMQQLLTKGIGHTEFKQTELGEIPSNWQIKKFEEVMVLQRGFDLPTQHRKEGNVPILSANGISGYHNEAKVKGPGIVTGRSGTIGKVHFIEQDYWALNTSLYVKEMFNNHPKYLFYFLSSFGIEKYSSGTGVPTLNRNDVHKELITVPSSKEEQQKIAQILSTVDEQIEVYEQEKIKYKELKKGLMQQLLTGQIRVKI